MQHVLNLFKKVLFLHSDNMPVPNAWSWLEWQYAEKKMLINLNFGTLNSIILHTHWRPWTKPARTQAHALESIYLNLTY